MVSLTLRKEFDSPGTGRALILDVMTNRAQHQSRSAAAQDAHDRRTALAILMEAFADATLDGLAEDCLTQAALFVALHKMVSCYGEEPVAAFAARLPERIRGGEFSIGARQ